MKAGLREPFPNAMLLDLDDTILDDTGGMMVCWESTCKHFSGDGGGPPLAFSHIAPIRVIATFAEILEARKEGAQGSRPRTLD
jgi:hypothetical protein